MPAGLLGRGAEGLSKAEVMGAEVAAAGRSLPGFLGRKNRYARVDDVLPQEPEDGGGVRVRGVGGSCRRYVFACSVFASLNHVLLGYGEQSSAPQEWRFVLDADLVLLIQLQMAVAFPFLGWFI